MKKLILGLVFLTGCFTSPQQRYSDCLFSCTNYNKLTTSQVDRCLQICSEISSLPAENCNKFR